MIADMINKKKLNPIVSELFIRGRKLNISIFFITQSYFKVPKDVRLKIQIKENFSKLLQITHQILTLKILLKFIKNVLQDHILF